MKRIQEVIDSNLKRMNKRKKNLTGYPEVTRGPNLTLKIKRKELNMYTAFPV